MSFFAPWRPLPSFALKKKSNNNAHNSVGYKVRNFLKLHFSLGNKPHYVAEVGRKRGSAFFEGKEFFIIHP